MKIAIALALLCIHSAINSAAGTEQKYDAEQTEKLRKAIGKQNRAYGTYDDIDVKSACAAIEGGADPNGTTCDRNPFLIAALHVRQGKSLPLVKTLVDKKADVSCSDKYYNALQVACTFNQSEDQLDTIKYLTQHGAPIDRGVGISSSLAPVTWLERPPYSNDTVKHICNDIFKHILVCGAALDTQVTVTPWGNASALMIAVRRGNLFQATSLLLLGADPNLADSEGRTARDPYFPSAQQMLAKYDIFNMSKKELAFNERLPEEERHDLAEIYCARHALVAKTKPWTLDDQLFIRMMRNRKKNEFDKNDPHDTQLRDALQIVGPLDVAPTILDYCDDTTLKPTQEVAP